MGYGNLGLTNLEVDAVVAFLETLTDGYKPEPGRPIPPLTVVSTPARSVITGVYPNPFNPSTTIGFDLSSPGRVRLAVYDVAGRQVRVLIDRSLPSGPGSAVWDGRDDGGRAVASGVYFCRLDAGRVHETKRVTLLK
jgi:hypothetical protein